MKQKTAFGFFVFLFIFTSVFNACGQTGVSGRYDAERDSIYSYFEFSDRNTVRIGSGIGQAVSEFMNPEALTVTLGYTIRNGNVIIEAQGMVIELKIIDANTLEAHGFMLDGVRYIKSAPSRQTTQPSQGQYDNENDFRVLRSPIASEGTGITGYTGTKKEIRIPPVIQGMTIDFIAEGAFANKQLTSVVVPNGVKHLAGFNNNQLTSIVIPNSVTYLAEFANNQLTSVVIPNSVTHIIYDVFANKQLTSVTIPNSVIHLGDNAFANNRLASVVISNSMTYILDGAFANNRLTSIVIPNSVTRIGSGAFANNPITSITIGANVQLGSRNETAFENGFDRFYNEQGKRAGTYTYSNGQWNVQFR